MATKATNTAEVTEARDEAAEGLLVDSMAQAVKKMVARGKERGYVTYDELNAALPQDQVSSEQIEDTMTMLSELGINVGGIRYPRQRQPRRRGHRSHR